MANIRITDLTAYTDAASTDVLPIVDVSNNVTKKVSISDLLKATPLGSAAAPAIAIDGDPNTGIYSPGADQLAVSTAGTGRLFIDSSGRVGIGTSSPSDRLHVANGYLRVTGPAGDGSNIYLYANNATTNPVRIGQGFGTATDNIGFIVNLAASDLILGTNNTERLRIDSSGRVGIGTSSPAHKFVVAGGSGANVGISGGSFGLRIDNDVTFGLTGTVIHGVDNTFAASYQPLVLNGSQLGLATGGTERMRIGSTGWTDVFGSSTYTLVARNAAGASTSTYLFAGAHSSTSTQNGTVSFLVSTNGNVANTNNVYGAISDIKLKENIVDANSQWDDIKALQVRNYNFKEGQTHTQIGLIAQEAELVSPGLVTESPDRDEEGSDLGTVTKSVNYSVLYMKAVKALQEAMERIETLEAKVAALEGA